MNRETRKFIFGLLMIAFGLQIASFGINRIFTNQFWSLGLIQLIIGILNILDGYKKAEETI